MKNAIFLIALMLLFSFSAFSQTKQNEELITIAKKMVEAQENYDPITLDKIYATDYIEISPKGEIDEREKAIGFYKVADAEKAKSQTPKYILDEFTVRHYGKFATVISRLSFGFKNAPENAPMVAGRITFTLRKEKDAWKISLAQFTPIPPPRPQNAK